MIKNASIYIIHSFSILNTVNDNERGMNIIIYYFHFVMTFKGAIELPTQNAF